MWPSPLATHCAGPAIRAVLTGGACASLYAKGGYSSLDADFVLGAPSRTSDLDRIMASLGFRRKGDHYVHANSRFFVEFPTGPLGIGQDFHVRPVWRRKGQSRTLSLSATDACRDRLAAFYFWSDRQALGAAIAIAVRNRLALVRIREWSRSEGHIEDYETFLAETRRVRSATRAVSPPRRRSPSRSRSAPAAPGRRGL